ncbi:mitochondrial fission 1 protein-like [Anneissia japonica]|uniref:mitochondrial fission 1 protein-like n=1 Tax=Anneissia japonica TaxID=1529436 RepID=UPI0014258FC0|nr:mitochondrial fission 1 protein-like [Anneissia japonica]
MIMETIVNDEATVSEIKKCEEVYNAELSRGVVTTTSQFQYAWCLVRSKYSNDMKKGVALLEELSHASHQQLKRDCFYYLAIGNYRLKEYTQALKYVRKVKEMEPKNRQALELESLIKKKMNQEGLVGMAIVGGAALALGGLIGAGFALSKK